MAGDTNSADFLDELNEVMAEGQPSTDLLLARLVADGINPFLRGCGYFIYIDFESKGIVMARIKKISGISEIFLEVISRTDKLGEMMEYLASFPKIREALQENAQYLISGTVTRSQLGKEVMREGINSERYR